MDINKEVLDEDTESTARSLDPVHILTGDDDVQSERSTCSSQHTAAFSSPNPSELDDADSEFRRKRRKHQAAAATSDPGTPRSAYPMSERQQLAFLKKISTPETADSVGAQHSPLAVSQTLPVTPNSCQRAGATVTRGTPNSTVHRRNDRGETRLHVAARRGEHKQCKQLIAMGALVDAIDNAGWTPLHEACNHGSYSAAHVLLRKGAAVNAVGLDDHTALHDAAANNNRQVLCLLLKYGASPHMRNKHGKLACDLCTDESCISLLKESAEQTPSLMLREGASSSSSCDSSALNLENADAEYDSPQESDTETSPQELEASAMRNEKMMDSPGAGLLAADNDNDTRREGKQEDKGLIGHGHDRTLSQPLTQSTLPTDTEDTAHAQTAPVPVRRSVRARYKARLRSPPVCCAGSHTQCKHTNNATVTSTEDTVAGGTVPTPRTSLTAHSHQVVNSPQTHSKAVVRRCQQYLRTKQQQKEHPSGEGRLVAGTGRRRGRPPRAGAPVQGRIVTTPNRANKPQRPRARLSNDPANQPSASGGVFDFHESDSDLESEALLNTKQSDKVCSPVELFKAEMDVTQAVNSDADIVVQDVPAVTSTQQPAPPTIVTASATPAPAHVLYNRKTRLLGAVAPSAQQPISSQQTQNRAADCQSKETVIECGNQQNELQLHSHVPSVERIKSRSAEKRRTRAQLKALSSLPFTSGFVVCPLMKITNRSHLNHHHHVHVAPQKRKLKQRVMLNAGQQASGAASTTTDRTAHWSQNAPNDNTDSLIACNSYEARHALDQMIRARWQEHMARYRLSVHGEHIPAAPNIQSFIIHKRSHLLHDRWLKQQAEADAKKKAVPPSMSSATRAVYDALFASQEHERQQLALQHKVHQQRLQMSVERQTLRVYQRYAHKAERPLSAVRVLRDNDIYNSLELDTPNLLSPNSAPVISQNTSQESIIPLDNLLQKITERYEKQKHELETRQSWEYQCLHGTQQLQWQTAYRKACRLTLHDKCPVPDMTMVPLLLVQQHMHFDMNKVRNH